MNIYYNKRKKLISFFSAGLITITSLPSYAKEINNSSNISVEGNLQGRWELSNNTTTNTWGDSIYIPRARFSSKWEPYEWAKLVMSLELTDGVELRNAYGEFTVLPEFKVTIGNFKKPFSRLRLASTFDLPILERGLLNDYAIRNTGYGGFGGRDFGLMFSGEHSFSEIKKEGLKIQYFLGTFNNDPEDNVFYRDIVGRFQVRILKGLILALNANSKYYQVSEALKNALLIGGDLKYELNDFKVQLEGSYGDNIDKNDKLWGTHVLTSYDFKIKDEFSIEPAIMVEVFDAESKVVDDLDFRFTTALNFHINKKARVILSLDKTIEDILKTSSSLSSPTKVTIQTNFTF